MKKASLHFRFSAPGNWGEFVLTALCPGWGGFIQDRRYTQADIPAGQAPALEAAVGVIAGMGEDWQAVQVWARRDYFLSGVISGPSGPLYEMRECIALTVEAINAQGGRRTFTAADYPEFAMEDPAALEFFDYFTRVS